MDTVMGPPIYVKPETPAEKLERAQVALNDILMGCDMFLQLPVARPTGAFLRYIEEVKRVAEGGL